jgi:membrane protein insertase Oxa1/YidC/SpoIIIJ
LAFGYPAALGIYWIFKCLLGILKQFILAKTMPLPVFTDEDYKEAEREVNARPSKKVAKSGRVVRSLHHIDDEDFADTAEKARIHKEALAAQEEADKKAAEEARKNSRFGGFKVKDNGTKNVKTEASEKDNGAEEKTDSDENGEN